MPKFCYLLIISFLLFIGCKEHKKLNSNKDEVFIIKDTTHQKDTISVVVKSDTLIQNQPEIKYLSKSLFINGTFPFEGEVTNLKHFIKKPESINTEIDGCGYILDDCEQEWYYQNCLIELSKTKYVFTIIDMVVSNYTVKYDSIIFSKNYTLQNFQKDFPASFNKNKTDKKNSTISINVPTHPLADDAFIFTFRDNKLIELHHFFPC